MDSGPGIRACHFSPQHPSTAATTTAPREAVKCVEVGGWSCSPKLIHSIEGGGGGGERLERTTANQGGNYEADLLPQEDSPSVCIVSKNTINSQKKAYNISRKEDRMFFATVHYCNVTQFISFYNDHDLTNEGEALHLERNLFRPDGKVMKIIEIVYFSTFRFLRKKQIEKTFCIYQEPRRNMNIDSDSDMNSDLKKCKIKERGSNVESIFCKIKTKTRIEKIEQADVVIFLGLFLPLRGSHEKTGAGITQRVQIQDTQRPLNLSLPTPCSGYSRFAIKIRSLEYGMFYNSAFPNKRVIWDGNNSNLELDRGVLTDEISWQKLQLRTLHSFLQRRSVILPKEARGGFGLGNTRNIRGSQKSEKQSVILAHRPQLYFAPVLLYGKGHVRHLVLKEIGGKSRKGEKLCGKNICGKNVCCKDVYCNDAYGKTSKDGYKMKIRFNWAMTTRKNILEACYQFDVEDSKRDDLELPYLEPELKIKKRKVTTRHCHNEFNLKHTITLTFIEKITGHGTVITVLLFQLQKIKRTQPTSMDGVPLRMSKTHRHQDHVVPWEYPGSKSPNSIRRACLSNVVHLFQTAYTTGSQLKENWTKENKFWVIQNPKEAYDIEGDFIISGNEGKKLRGSSRFYTLVHAYAIEFQDFDLNDPFNSND
eukprot:bmy_15092T0